MLLLDAKYPVKVFASKEHSIEPVVVKKKTSFSFQFFKKKRSYKEWKPIPLYIRAAHYVQFGVKLSACELEIN